MEPVSRRAFFQRAGAVAGAAAVAGAVASVPAGVAGALVSPRREEVPLTERENLAPGTQLVAHVQSARSGVVHLFVGERQFTVRDRGLAARLVRAAK